MSEISLTVLVNNALILLGSSTRITDIEGPGSLTAQARDLLPVVIPDILEQHPWNFAITRVEVPRENLVELAGAWPWRYALPAGCISWLPWGPEDENRFDGVEEDGYLLCADEGPIIVRYIRDERSPVKWSPLFRSAFVARMAVDLADTVSAKQSMRDRAQTRYDDKIGKAKRADGLKTNNRDRGDPRRLSHAVGAMHRGGGGDPARWHR